MENYISILILINLLSIG